MEGLYKLGLAMAILVIIISVATLIHMIAGTVSAACIHFLYKNKYNKIIGYLSGVLFSFIIVISYIFSDYSPEMRKLISFDSGWAIMTYYFLGTTLAIGLGLRYLAPKELYEATDELIEENVTEQ